jgi:hypothetical protein
MIASEHLKFEKHMWRVTIDGKHYCAETKEALKYGLRQLDISVTEPVVVVEDNRSDSEKLIELLRAITTPMIEKQDALVRIMFRADTGDNIAREFVKTIPAHRSYDAKYFTKQLGKTDFLFVTPLELHEVVDDVVLRSKLISELGKLYKGL